MTAGIARLAIASTFLASTIFASTIFASVLPASAADYGVRRMRADVPHFNWNYKHMYGPAYQWPDGTMARPDAVIAEPGLQPIGLYLGHYPYCLYGAATYRAQGGRWPCG